MQTFKVISLTTGSKLDCSFIKETKCYYVLYVEGFESRYHKTTLTNDNTLLIVEEETPVVGASTRQSTLYKRLKAKYTFQDKSTPNTTGEDFYYLSTIEGVSYYTPNDEDMCSIIAMDENNGLAEYTGFYDMDDIECEGSEYKLVLSEEGVLVSAWMNL